MSKDLYKKVGNLWFHEQIESMDYSLFVSTYKDVLKGCAIDDAAKKLGIKIPKPKKREE